MGRAPQKSGFGFLGPWRISCPASGDKRPETLIYDYNHHCIMSPQNDANALSCDFRGMISRYRDFAQDKIITDLSEPDPHNYPMVVPTKNGNASKLNWAAIQRFAIDSGYRIDGSKLPLTSIYRFDLNTGYYEPVTEDHMVLYLISHIKADTPDFCIPSNFPTLVSLNIPPVLPDVRTLTGTSDEFDSVRGYYDTQNLIPFKNGIYSINANALLPRTSFIFIEHPLNVDFNPEALADPICERYMDIMCQRPDLFELLFEQIGYTLYARDFIVPTITIFYGAGANGKSIVLDVVKRIVGANNTSALSMYDMINAFSLAQSEGKLVNISSDSSAGPGDSIIATANIAEFLKKASSGEEFAFNPKHGKIHNGYGPRKFLFASNVMLKFGDLDGGLARRIYTLPFDASFQENNTVKASFFTKNAIEWFAMQALISMCQMIYRAMGNIMFSTDRYSGEYISCEPAGDMKVEQMTTSDTVLDWLNEDMGVDILNVDEVRRTLLGVPNLWECYKAYCGESCRQWKTRKSFQSMLKARYKLGFRRTTNTFGHCYVAIDEE